MNNNQNNLNNPQMNNFMGNNNFQPSLNVIPTNNNQNMNTNNLQNNQNFINPNQFNDMQTFNQNNSQQIENEDTLVIKQTNKFINNNIDTSNTSLNNLNIDGAYNNMPKVDYSQDPKVRENMQKKNTVTITSEGKVFIIIIAILLIFIFVLPMVFDFIANISYK